MWGSGGSDEFKRPATRKKREQQTSADAEISGRDFHFLWLACLFSISQHSDRWQDKLRVKFFLNRPIKVQKFEYFCL